MVLDIRLSTLPFLHLYLPVHPPIYQKAEPKRELFSTLSYTLLGLYNFGQKRQEEGKRA